MVLSGKRQRQKEESEMTIQEAIKTLKTAEIINLYNSHLMEGASAVKKFSDRAAAEKRLLKLAEENLGLMDRLNDLANGNGSMPLLESDLVDPKPEPELGNPQGLTLVGAKALDAVLAAKKAAEEKEAKKVAKATKKAAAGPKKQKTIPQINLRCPSCGFFAKTTTEWHAKGKLVCPMNKAHGVLQTAEERGEKRGR